jgi:hypothetical protein
VRGQDYTATNGTSVGALTALVASDVVEVFAYVPFNIANALTVSTVDAKGDLLVGTGADAVGRLAVGTNNQLLAADSSTGSGLKWANPGMTLIKTQSFSAVASSSVDDVFSSTYDSYRIVLRGTASTIAEKAIFARLRVSGTDTTTNYKAFLNTPFESNYTGGPVANLVSTTHLIVAFRHSTTGSNASSFDLHFPNIATQTINQGFYNSTGNTTVGNAGYCNGILNDTTQYTSISFIAESGNITGNVSIYGYNK